VSRVPGTFLNRPPAPQRAHYPEGLADILRRKGATDIRRWLVGDCNVLISREPVGSDGRLRLHVSVSHPERYPTWDEIKTAVYGTDVPKGITLAQVLTLDDSPWVDIHQFCFHLYEIEDPWA
jgi:hypothetical protein